MKQNLNYRSTCRYLYWSKKKKNGLKETENLSIGTYLITLLHKHVIKSRRTPFRWIIEC